MIKACPGHPGTLSSQCPGNLFTSCHISDGVGRAVHDQQGMGEFSDVAQRMGDHPQHDLSKAQ